MKIKLLTLLSLVFVFSSCKKDKELSFPNIKIEGVADNRKSGGSDIEALYLGELEIVAYDHRPGESLQNNSVTGRFGFTGKDWSYFTILPSGLPEARDIALFRSGAININDFLEHQYADKPNNYFSEEYLDAEIPFNVDVLEVYMYRTGVVKDGKYFGQNGDFNGHDKHPMHKYANFSSIPNHYARTIWPGINKHSQDISIMFVRSSIIYSPLQITTKRENGELVIDQADRIVEQREEDFIKSLINQGTSRRSYAYVNIIPYIGAIEWDFSGNDVPDITVKIDMDKIVDINQTDFTEIENTPSGQWNGEMFYLGDLNDIPFGLELSF